MKLINKFLLVALTTLASTVGFSQALQTKIDQDVRNKTYRPDLAADTYQATADRVEVFTAAGTNSYTVTINSITTLSGFKGTLKIKFTNANSGASTLTITGSAGTLASVPLKKAVSTALTTGDILAGQVYELLYDGTNFQINVPGTGGGGSGTVTSVTSADANATVANTTTTPVITIVSAPRLQTARTINGTSFDGTGNVTVTAAAGTLTGTTLNSSVVTSSLTSVGTLGTGVWNATVIDPAYGGTGANNTVTTGGSLVGSGGTYVNVPIGTANQVPTSNGTTWTWQSPSAFSLNQTSLKTTSYTASANDLVETDATGGTVPITLPTAPANHTLIAILQVNSGGNTTTVTTGGTDLFNKVTGGATVYTLRRDGEGMIIQYSTGSPGLWAIVAKCEGLGTKPMDGTSNLSEISSAGTALENIGAGAALDNYNSQSGDYTFVLTDAAGTTGSSGKRTYVEGTSGSAQTYTIPPHSSVAFPVGCTIGIYQNGAGLITVAPGAGVTLNSASGSLITGGQHSFSEIKQVTQDNWEAIVGLSIPENGVANAKLAQMADGTIKGRHLGGGTGNAEDLTDAQARSIVLNSSDYFSIRADFGGDLAGLVTASSGTGASCSASTTNAVAGHPGLGHCTTGTTTTGVGAMKAGVAGVMFTGDGPFQIDVIFRIPTLSNGTDTFTFWCGLSSSTSTGDGGEAATIRYSDGLNSGKFQGVTRHSSSESTVDMTVTVVAGTWYHATISSDPSNATYTFTIGGVTKTLNTNIPTSGIGLFEGLVKSAGTTGATVDFDLIDLRQNFTTAR